MANLVPLLSEQSRPRRVLLVVTPAMTAEAHALERVIRPTGVTVDFLHVEGALMLPVAEKLIAWLAAHEREHVWLNATGGNKPMSLAAVSAFGVAGRDSSVFYVHQATGQFEWLTVGANDAREAPVMSARPNLNQFLGVHGFEVISRSAPHFRSGEIDGLDRLVDLAGSHGVALGQMNYKIHSALDKHAKSDPWPLTIEHHRESNDQFGRIVDHFCDLGALRRRGERLLEIASEQDAHFVAGGWLERWIGAKLAALTKEFGLRDVATSVQVKTNGGVKNELDAVALRGSRLLLIECKTRAESPDGRFSDQALSKLDMLGRLGGRMNISSMLVSYRELRESTKQRAADLGICVVDAKGIGRMQERLRQWIMSETNEA